MMMTPPDVSVHSYLLTACDRAPSRAAPKKRPASVGRFRPRGFRLRRFQLRRFQPRHFRPQRLWMALAALGALGLGVALEDLIQRQIGDHLAATMLTLIVVLITIVTLAPSIQSTKR